MKNQITGSPMLIKLDENNFEKELQNGLKLVEFFAPWCGHCTHQAPVLKEMDKMWIGQVDGENSPKLIQKLHVSAYPTFILFNNGKEMERFTGFHTKYDIMNILSKYFK